RPPRPAGPAGPRPGPVAGSAFADGGRYRDGFRAADGRGLAASRPGADRVRLAIRLRPREYRGVAFPPGAGAATGARAEPDSRQGAERRRRALEHAGRARGDAAIPCGSARNRPGAWRETPHGDGLVRPG